MNLWLFRTAPGMVGAQSILLDHDGGYSAYTTSDLSERVSGESSHPLVTP